MNEDANTGKSAGGTGVGNEQLSPTYLLALQSRIVWLSHAYWVALKYSTICFLGSLSHVHRFLNQFSLTILSYL